MIRPNADDLATAMGKSWWLLLLRGLVAIVFALLTWLQPAASLAGHGAEQEKPRGCNGCV